MLSNALLFGMLVNKLFYGISFGRSHSYIKQLGQSVVAKSP